MASWRPPGSILEAETIRFSSVFAVRTRAVLTSSDVEQNIMKTDAKRTLELARDDAKSMKNCSESAFDGARCSQRAWTLLRGCPARGRFWTSLGRSWPALGSLLGRSWAALGCSWAALGRSWAALGRSWVALGRSWGALGRS